MTAVLKLTYDKPVELAGPDPHDWLALDQAAELLGKHRDHLARECRDKLERFGMAMKAKPAEGGPPQWFINRRHHAKLLPGKVGEGHRLPDLSPYTKRQIDDAFARVACVELYREARANWRGNQGDWMPRLLERLQTDHPGIKISERSLRRWWKDYNGPADFEQLIVKSGGNRRGEADPACWQMFEQLYLDDREPSLTWCWRQVKMHAQAEGLRWLTESACRCQLDRRIPPEEQAKYRRPKDYRDKFQPYAEWADDAFQAGENWLGDHCILDLLCGWGTGKDYKMIRPWLTAWMDWRTRRIVGWCLSDGPNSQTILAAFKHGIEDPANHGGPGIVWIDNGRDYDSYVFHGMTKAERRQAQKDRMVKRELGRLAKIDGGMRVDETRVRSGVFNLLGIDAHFSLPYNPTGKSRLERWFGTMHGQFDKLFETYCGLSTDRKPESLAGKLKDRPHLVPSFETVRKELAVYIETYNATVSMNRRGAEGMSPDQAMATLPHTIRKPADPQALRQCLAMWHKPVRVGRNGVRIAPSGVPYTYGRYAHELRALIRSGKDVHISYDPKDMRRVEVYDENMRHLCTASLNERIGQGKVKHEEVKQLVSERRKRKKQRAELSRTAIQDILPIGTAADIEQCKAERASERTAEPRIEAGTETRNIKLESKRDQRPIEDILKRLVPNGFGDISERLADKARKPAAPDDDDNFTIFDPDATMALIRKANGFDDDEDDLDVFGLLAAKRAGGAA